MTYGGSGKASVCYPINHNVSAVAFSSNAWLSVSACTQPSFEMFMGVTLVRGGREAFDPVHSNCTPQTDFAVLLSQVRCLRALGVGQDMLWEWTRDTSREDS